MTASSSPTLIDTHCHLDSEYFPDGPDEAIARARQQGINHFVVIGVGADGSAAKQAVALSERRADVSATVGMHPHDAKALDSDMQHQLAQLAQRPRVVAIGEVGLDYHYLHSPKAQQQHVFRTMIALARTLRKPLVIHTRSAPDDTLSLLEENNAAQVGGIIHCFSEDRAFAKRALDMNFDLSFSGIVTFKNARSIHDVASWAPADRIMVETDSPYLAPVPVRGKRNEPANLVHTARRVAELRNISFEDIARISSENARRRLGM